MGRVSIADLGFGVVVLRVLILVREVALLRIEERSDAAEVEARELREEGGRERGGGGGPSRFGTRWGEVRGEVGAEADGLGGRRGSLGGSRLA